MPDLFLSLTSEADADAIPPDANGALFRIDGDDDPTPMDERAGPGAWLRFDLSTDALRTQGKVIETHRISVPEGPVLMRVDKVTFPPGAIAYRHVHAGAGIRVLDRGELHLHADDHDFIRHPGESWFEAANSPVKAIASDTVGARFIRFMAVPPEFEGKSTIRFLDEADAGRPRLQVTHRFFERMIHVDAG